MAVPIEQDEAMTNEIQGRASKPGVFDSDSLLSDYKSLNTMVAQRDDLVKGLPDIPLKIYARFNHTGEDARYSDIVGKDGTKVHFEKEHGRVTSIHSEKRNGDTVDIRYEDKKLSSIHINRADGKQSHYAYEGGRLASKHITSPDGSVHHVDYEKGRPSFAKSSKADGTEVSEHFDFDGKRPMQITLTTKMGYSNTYLKNHRTGEVDIHRSSRASGKTGQRLEPQ